MENQNAPEAKVPPSEPAQTNEQPQVLEKKPMMKKINTKKGSKKTLITLVVAFVVVVAGVGTGWALSGGLSAGSKTSSETAAPGAKENPTEAGLSDESTFSDTAEGELKKGGIEGEGTHYLDRNAGPEKNVYLVSTVIDLSSFEGKNVQVWGQTIAAEHAPWLMDVGKIKVVE